MPGQAGQFVLHARTPPGNPYDGHPLGAVIEATEGLTGREIERAYVDNAATMPQTHAASQAKRGVFKREVRRRSAIEAVIGHMKAEGHLGRCYLKGRAGDAANSAPSVTTFVSFPSGSGRFRAPSSPRYSGLGNPASPQTGFLTGDYLQRWWWAFRN